MINHDRLWDRLHELGEIGKQESGGVTRFSYTEEDRKAKELVAKYMAEAGLEVQEDHIGNLIGKKTGKIKNAPSVIIGSHIDTVKEGGIFDGALGVIAGIEVLQTMNERNISPDHPIEVIAFADEEGSRFHFGMIGSRAFTGTLNKSDLQRTDQHGISIEKAMKLEGLNPDKIDDVKRDPKSIKCYLELHIEQGKVLEEHDLPVGIVSGIAGPLWTKWALTGESGHAGATPMSLRKDPLIPFADIIKNIENEAKKNPHMVATIGKVSVKPGGVNIIPGQVEFTLDLRDIDENVRNQAEKAIQSYANHLCNEQNIDIGISTLQRISPVPCSQKIRQLLEESCKDLGIQTMTLPSGAGHDAMQFKSICPIGMLFVRSRKGISHNPSEYSSKMDCAKGANVLYHTVLKLTV